MMPERRIKVCHVLTDTNIGGAGKALAALISAADRERFAFSVVLPQGSAVRGLLAGMGVALTEAPYLSDRSFDARAVPALSGIFRKIRPDIVHTHSAFSARLAARLCGVPAVIMTHHCATAAKIPLGGILQPLTATRAIAVSRGAADALAASGMPRGRITVIQNGALPLRRPSDDEKREIRQKLGIPDGAFTVGIFGRLEACKRHDVFIRAAAICAEKAPDAHFIIVGDGTQRRELEHMAADLSETQRLHFCGFCEDVAPYMAICAANVNTTAAGEASSMAIAEGMSLGVPPIMCGTADNRRAVSDCGLLTRPGSAGSTAAAILRLMRDSALRDALSAAALKHYTEHNTPKMCADATQTVYLDAVGSAF